MNKESWHNTAAGIIILYSRVQLAVFRKKNAIVCKRLYKQKNYIKQKPKTKQKPNSSLSFFPEISRISATKMSFIDRNALCLKESFCDAS